MAPGERPDLFDRETPTSMEPMIQSGKARHAGSAKREAGDIAPQFRLADQNGQQFDLLDNTVAGKPSQKFRRAVRPRMLYQHRCPVCSASRVARRPVRRWRCRACRESGLEGALEISTQPS